MPDLTKEQLAQMDSNIKKMLEQGASNDDVISYSNDFKNSLLKKKV